MTYVLYPFYIQGCLYTIVSHYYINFVERKLAIVIVLFHTTMNGPFSYS